MSMSKPKPDDNKRNFKSLMQIADEEKWQFKDSDDESTPRIVGRKKELNQ